MFPGTAMLPYLPGGDALFHAENLWGQIRVLIGEYTQREQELHHFRHIQQQRILRELEQDLVTTFDITDLMDILEVSRANNDRDGITGVLLLSNNHIVQCLEGSREAVNATYARIIRDRRHRQPVLLDYRVIQARTFPDWSMGYVPESSLSRSILQKYSASATFEPGLLGGETCLAMLTELSREVPTV